MSAVALYVSRLQILKANRGAEQTVAIAQGCVNFAVSMLGHCVDYFGASIVRRMNQRLANSLVRIKGFVALVPELDPNEIIDDDSIVGPHLDRLQGALSDLRAASLKARDDMKLRRTHEAFRENVELCAALHEAVEELKLVIRDHDKKAVMGGDTRRLMADLRRTDDVPAGYYAELGSAMRKLPHERRT
jgi:hypothetical protein